MRDRRNGLEKKISIVMPVYNARQWINDAVYNIQKQTYTNWELIIVNDGSTDNTGEVCSKLASEDSRIRVLTQCNNGPSAARNFGLSQITGDYFTIIDCDDVLYCNALEEYLYIAEKYNADTVIAGYKTVNMSTGVIYSSVASEERCYQPHGIINTEQTEMLVRAGLMASNWNKLYKATLAYLRFNTDISLNEDVLFSLSALSDSDVVAVTPAILYEYRIQNHQSLSKKFHPEFPKALEELEEQLISRQEKKLRRGLYIWLMNYLYIYLQNICLNDSIGSNRLQYIEDVVNSKLFKKYGTIYKADTFNRKVAVCMLRWHLYKLYVNVIRAKRR